MSFQGSNNTQQKILCIEKIVEIPYIPHSVKVVAAQHAVQYSCT